MIVFPVPRWFFKTVLVGLLTLILVSWVLVLVGWLIGHPLF